MGIIMKMDLTQVATWKVGQEKAVWKATQRAGVDALRAMRAEASRRIRDRKNIKVSAIGKRITVLKRRSGDGFVWAVRASGESLPIAAFGGLRQVGKGRRKLRKRKDGITRGGVIVEINKGAPKLIPGAFIATMKSGHKGVFRRERRKLRLPIEELFTTTVADAFRDAVPFIAARGEEVFKNAFIRNLRAATGASAPDVPTE